MKSKILLKEYSDTSASNVWQQIDKYSTFSGEILFGIEDVKVKEIIFSKVKPTCFIQNLSNPEVFDDMFEAYLYNHIYKDIYSNFVQKSTKTESFIIELGSIFLAINIDLITISSRILRA